MQKLSEPKTKEDFKKSIKTFVHEYKLHKFFPTADDPLLETLVSKAVDLQNDDTSVLGQSTNTENLVKFALYQPVVYCGTTPHLRQICYTSGVANRYTDDSGSMAPEYNDQDEDRMANQRDLVRRIASICTQVVPDHLGVHLRFINEELPHLNDLRMDAIEAVMSRVKANGSTEIGTNLRKRILEPFVYDTKMTRPLVVSIITDGVPRGPKGSAERRNTLRDEILKCKDYLLKNSLPSRGKLLTSHFRSTCG